MEAFDEEASNENDNIKKFRMTLLYFQKENLKSLYHKGLVASPERFYLVDKKWLDEFREKNDYKNIVNEISHQFSPNITSV